MPGQRGRNIGGNSHQTIAMARQEDNTVMLSAAKHLKRWGPRSFANAQGDIRGKQQACPCCHAERSEASQALGTEILR